MAYDIYGNDLRRGYCEVHPHVHQEYPCDICCRDIEQSNRQNQQNQQGEQIQQSNDLETVRVVIDMLIIRIPKSDLDAGSIDVDFNGQYMIQIQKEESSNLWIVTNAMNGYGHNCFEEFKGSEVSILNK
jgi:hypothetical protein